MTIEEAIDVLKHNYPSACFTELCEAVEIAIKALSVQPERKKGEWINVHISVSGDSDAECNLCGAVVHTSFSDQINYCPNCGERMENS